MRRLLLLCLVSALWAAAPERASAALEPDALRRDLTQALAMAGLAYGGIGIENERVEAVAEGDGVRVRLIGLSVSFPDTEGGLDFGDLSFLVRDAGSGRYQVSDVRSQSLVALRDETGLVVGDITYVLDRFAGVWSPPLMNFLDLDLILSDFKAVVPDLGLAVALDRLAAESRVMERADGLVDTKSSLRARRLRAGTQAAGRVTVDSLAVEAEAAGQDLSAYAKLWRDTLASTSPETPPSQEEVTAFLTRLAEVDVWPHTLAERFRLYGLFLFSAGKDEPEARLDEFEVDLVGHDLHDALGRGSLGIRMSGLGLRDVKDDATAPLAQLVPSDAGLILSVERLPLDTLWDQLIRGMAVAAAKGEPSDESDRFPSELATTLMDALKVARTALRLDRLDVVAPGGRILAGGVLEANDGVPNGASARLDAMIVGLDGLAAAAANAAAQDPSGATGIGDVTGFLFLLKALGQRETGTDGVPVDRFALEMTGDGQIRLNGKPLEDSLGPGTP